MIQGGNDKTRVIRAAVVVGLAGLLALSACENASSSAPAAVDSASADLAVGDAATTDAAADAAKDTVVDTTPDAGADTAVADATGTPDSADSGADTAKPDGLTDAEADTSADVAKDTLQDTADSSGSSDMTAADAKDAAVDTGLCPAPQPPGTVCQGSVWMCAPGYFHGFGKSECFEATCENMSKVLKESLDAVVTKSHTCVAGGEDGCVVVSTSTACQGTCGMAVNGGMANDVALVVGWVDEHICKAFGYAAKCGYSTPKCMAPKPFCNAGTCAYAP